MGWYPIRTTKKLNMKNNVIYGFLRYIGLDAGGNIHVSEKNPI